MVFPLDENLDPTFEDLYEKLYLYDEDDPDGEGYFIKNAKKSFPSVLSEVEMFQVIIREVMTILFLAIALILSYTSTPFIRGMITVSELSLLSTCRIASSRS